MGSFFLRVFSGLINKRYTEMEILRKIAAKKAAILRAKLAKIAKAKKEKALKLAKLKKACKGKKGKGKCKALLKKKGKKGKGKGKKGKGKGKGKKGKGKKKPAKKVLKCKQNCKKGLVGKWTLKKNTKAQAKFVKAIRLSTFKGQTLAALFGHWVMQIIKV